MSEDLGGVTAEDDDVGVDVGGGMTGFGIAIPAAPRPVEHDEPRHHPAHVEDEDDGSEAVTEAVAEAMTPAAAKPAPRELTEEEKKELEERRKEAIAEHERIKEIRVATLHDAARLIRAGMILIAESGQRVVDSGLIGNLDKPLQMFIQNALEVEREYQAVLAGEEIEDEEESVPSILADFIKRSELEEAERKAAEEAEREAARRAAAAAAMASAPSTPGYVDDERPSEDQYEKERQAQKEAVQKKIDEFFGGDIF